MRKKISLDVTCKRHRFGYWNSCKRLPNFANVAALISSMNTIEYMVYLQFVIH